MLSTKQFHDWWIPCPYHDNALFLFYFVCNGYKQNGSLSCYGSQQFKLSGGASEGRLCQRKQGMPTTLHRHDPLPVFYIRFRPNIVQPRRVSFWNKSTNEHPTILRFTHKLFLAEQYSKIESAFLSFLDSKCKCYLRMTANGAPNKIVTETGKVSGYSLRLCQVKDRLGESKLEVCG